jgi:hypothetical protein
MFVYQLLYWSWLKLEANEEAEKNDEQLKGLKKVLVDTVKKQSAAEKK